MNIACGSPRTALTRLLMRGTNAANLVRSLAAGLGIQAALVISGIANARLLGPTDRGHFAFFTLIPSILYQLGTLGLPASLTHAVSSGRLSRSRAVRLAVGVGTVQTLVLTLINALILDVANAFTYAPVAAWISLVGVAASVVSAYCLAFFQVELKLSRFNVARVAPPILFSVTLLGLIVLHHTSLALVTLAYFATAAVVALGAVGALWQRSANAHGETQDTISTREVFAFGLRSLFSVASPIESLKLDQASVAIFLPASYLGEYVVAMSFTNILRFIASSVGNVLYPRVAREPRDGVRLVRRYTAGTALGTALMAIPLAVAIPWVLPRVYGQAFAPAVHTSQLLLIATLLLATRRVMSDGLRGLGRPDIPSAAEIGALLMATLAVVPLTKIFGLVGVALALIAAFGVALLVVAIGLRRAAASTRRRSGVGTLLRRLRPSAGLESLAWFGAVGAAAVLVGAAAALGGTKAGLVVPYVEFGLPAGVVLRLMRASLAPGFISPVMIAAVAMLLLAVTGPLFYASVAGTAEGGAIRLYLPNNLTVETSRILLIAAFSIVVGAAVSVIALRKPATAETAMAPIQVGRRMLRWFGWLAPVPAVMIIIEYGPHYLLSRSEYLDAGVSQGHFAGAGEQLALATVLGLGVACARGGASTRLVALGGGVVYFTLFFALATRRLALVPVLFALGAFAARPSRATRAGVIGGALLALYLVRLPLYLRGQEAHGLFPYWAAMPGFWHSTIGWSATARNLLISFPIIGATAFLQPPIPHHDFWVALNPMPGGSAGWYAIAANHRLNAATPYAGVGELGNAGLSAVAGYYFVAGLVLGFLDWRIRRLLPAARTMHALLFTAFAALFTFFSLQYNLRSATRLLYYCIAADLALFVVRRVTARAAEVPAHTRSTAANGERLATVASRKLAS